MCTHPIWQWYTRRYPQKDKNIITRTMPLSPKMLTNDYVIWKWNPTTSSRVPFINLRMSYLSWYLNIFCGSISGLHVLQKCPMNLVIFQYVFDGDYNTLHGHSKNSKNITFWSVIIHSYQHKDNTSYRVLFCPHL